MELITTQNEIGFESSDHFAGEEILKDGAKLEEVGDSFHRVVREIGEGAVIMGLVNIQNKILFRSACYNTTIVIPCKLGRDWTPLDYGDGKRCL